MKKGQPPGGAGGGGDGAGPGPGPGGAGGPGGGPGGAGPVLQSQAAPPQAQQATAPGHCCGGFVVGLQHTLLPAPHARHVPPGAADG